jgi:ABC-type transporter Mla maintaining outer membrane lipid asymmetry ATPase subunit MlaF
MATNGGNGTRAAGPRCVALVGPFQSGKTTLLEAILARTGAIARQGTIDAGNTVGDASKEARHHRMSVELTVATTTLLLALSIWRWNAPLFTRNTLLLRSCRSRATPPIWKKRRGFRCWKRSPTTMTS